MFRYEQSRWRWVSISRRLRSGSQDEMRENPTSCRPDSTDERGSALACDEPALELDTMWTRNCMYVCMFVRFLHEPSRLINFRAPLRRGFSLESKFVARTERILNLLPWHVSRRPKTYVEVLSPELSRVGPRLLPLPRRQTQQPRDSRRNAPGVATGSW